MDIILTIISSLLSGIIGVIISTAYYKRYENRKTKFETLKRIFGNRFDLKGDAFSQSINELLIVFENSKDVKKALSEYHKSVSSGAASEEELIRLFKAMFRDLSINISEFNDSFFLKPFNTKPNCSAGTLEFANTGKKDTEIFEI